MTATPLHPAHIPPARHGRPTRVTFWDRAAVALLGTLGFALSYDALQQMAVAIHIRGPLTYAFPLVIDGFIAYGVRALLVLRNAPWPARAYAWTLFAGATAASVWANALHAIRLNQQAPEATGLRLGDSVVGFLSTLAPLALAGSVHLYILIARHATTPPATGPLHGPAGRTRRPDHQLTETPGTPPVEDARPSPATGPAASVSVDYLSAGPAGGGKPSDRPELTGYDHADADRTPEDHALGDERAGRGQELDSGRALATRPVGRPPGASLDELMVIGRQAWTDSGRLSRTVVGDAIRVRDISLSSDRLTAVMDRLRAEYAAAEQAQDGQLTLA